MALPAESHDVCICTAKYISISHDKMQELFCDLFKFFRAFVLVNMAFSFIFALPFTLALALALALTLTLTLSFTFTLGFYFVQHR